ncbi:MAG: hypothetical protein M3O61_04820 [Gemmatimonadota bacterium]|nr:hypothetical protein [Gemmatimonadota bacterium]
MTFFIPGGYSLDRVCVGDKVSFQLRAERRLANKRLSASSDGDEPTNPAEQVPGVRVDGSVLNPGYGTLEPASSTTGYIQGPYLWLGDKWVLQPAVAVFAFAGLRPGSTELRFTGVHPDAGFMNGYDRTYAPLKRGVTVVSCNSHGQPLIDTLDAGSVPKGASAGSGSGVSKDRKGNVKTVPKVGVTTISKVRVTSTSTWSVGMDIVATIDEAVMDADDQGHFAGSADVTWQTSVIGTATCGAAEHATPPSRADLTGEIDESNQLVVTITFQPRDFSGFATCGPATVSTGNLATPDPLTIRVAATGGISTQPHSVTAKNGAFPGSVTIVVTPEIK